MSRKPFKRCCKSPSRHRAAGIAWAVAMLLASAGYGQDTDRWHFRQFQVDNDDIPVPFLGTEDRFYTNGIRVSLAKAVSGAGTGTSGLPPWLRAVRNWCAACDIYPALAIGHQLYTPEDLEDPGPQPGERPWAAWLYAGLGAAIDTAEDTRHDVELQIGVTGDAALGEPAQSFWHDVAHGPEARGWDNQLGPDLGINGYYNFQHILWSARDEETLDWDFVPRVEAAVGTMMTYAGVGATVRLGRGITGFPHSPMPPGGRRVPNEATPDLGIYGFVGIDVRAVAYNYLLEGSLFRDEPVTVEPERYVRDIQLGVTARFRHYRLTYAVVRRSEEFERSVGTDSGVHTFTSLSLTVGIR